MTEQADITIIGGGVIGNAIAYELSKQTDKDIFLIERNSNFQGENQSSRNSGVIHAGIYYPKKKGPLKAKFCVEGNQLLYEFCKRHGVPHKNTGKLLVATNDQEEEYLDDTLNTALENGVPCIRKISGEEARQMEPNVKATSALIVPTSGIIEPTEYVRKLHYLADSNGVLSVPGTEVISIKPKNGIFEVMTQSGINKELFETSMIVNAAGLYSDKIARMVNTNSPYVMDPVRGEAAKFYKTRRPELDMKGMNVYPAPYGFYNDTGKKAEVPFEEFKRLIKEGAVTKTVGVHLTPTFDIVDREYDIGKTVTLGPTSTVDIGREDYNTDLHPTEHYYNKVKNFFPNLRLEDIELHQAGIRAKLRDHYDFVVERDSKHSNCINVLGIDSPGLTSSLAIAKYVGKLLEK